MENSELINLRNSSLLLKKTALNLVLNIVISILGISALFIKFFIYDGIIAFRAFTVDGNIFTTVVSVFVVIVSIKERIDGKEFNSLRLYYLELASAVTEAVIFVIVMIGYLPFVPDDPKITPYHMFCLHVAIPILAVLRFIFLQKPHGVIKPSKLLIGAMPIGVYGIGVVTAIKLDILPVSLIPYSFLDFENNFLWYFIFALIVIPTFGFVWAWSFYRLNIKASFLWYSKDDLKKLQEERIKSKSNFDVVNSNILLIYLAIAIIVLMFSLLGTSRTSTKIQHKMASATSFLMLDDYDHMLGDGQWHIKDGILYKGDMQIGDGTEENINKEILSDDIVVYDLSIFVQAKDLSPEIASKYNPLDYVSVSHSSGLHGPIYKCGEVLDDAIVGKVFESTDSIFYDEVKVGKDGYYRYCQAFGSDMRTEGVGMIILHIPSSELTTLAKNEEYNHDVMMIVVIVTCFAFLFIITLTWIKTLEKSVDFLRAIASGRIPEKPIQLRRSGKFSWLEKVLNTLREINKD